MTKVMVTSPTSTVLVAGGGGPVFVGYGFGTNATKLRGIPIAVGTPGEGTALVVTAGVYTPTLIATAAQLDAVALMTNNHIANLANPHQVTKTQVGLGNVENTALSTGNAGSATVLQTARSINGVSFNGSADITVSAAAGTLTGTALAATVVTSSLTSVGTLTTLNVAGVTRVGTATAVQVGGTTPNLSVHATGSAAQFSITRWEDTATGPSLTVAKSRSGTIGTFIAVGQPGATNVLAGDVLGNVTAYADDGRDLATVGGRMRFVVASSVSVAENRVPVYIEWQTASGLSDNSATGKMWLTELGVFMVGNTMVTPTAGSLAEFFGNSGTSTITPISVRIRTTASANNWLTGPTNYWGSYGFWSDDVTSPGASSRGRWAIFSENANGSAHGSAIWVGPASGIAVSVTFNSDTTVDFSGALKRAGTQVVNTRRTGWTTVPTGTLDRTTFVSDTATLPQVAARLAALIIDLHGAAGHGLIGA